MHNLDKPCPCRQCSGEGPEDDTRQCLECGHEFRPSRRETLCEDCSGMWEPDWDAIRKDRKLEAREKHGEAEHDYERDL